MINLMNEDQEHEREFYYFNEEGVFMGKSEGTAPLPELFDQAHYVVDSDNELVKNRDLLIIARRKLVNLQRALVNVPIQDMHQIMDINDQIKSLEQKIHDLTEPKLPKAG